MKASVKGYLAGERIFQEDSKGNWMEAIVMWDKFLGSKLKDIPLSYLHCLNGLLAECTYSLSGGALSDCKKDLMLLRQAIAHTRGDRPPKKKDPASHILGDFSEPRAPMRTTPSPFEGISKKLSSIEESLEELKNAIARLQ